MFTNTLNNSPILLENYIENTKIPSINQSIKTQSKFHMCTCAVNARPPRLTACFTFPENVVTT